MDSGRAASKLEEFISTSRSLCSDSDEIVAYKRENLKLKKGAVSQAELERRAAQQPAPQSLRRTLHGPGLKIIREVKRASPSRGVIRDCFKPVSIARTYASGAPPPYRC